MVVVEVVSNFCKAAMFRVGLAYTTQMSFRNISLSKIFPDNLAMFIASITQSAIKRTRLVPI